jgi:SpoIID/LytB domain protein
MRRTRFLAPVLVAGLAIGSTSIAPIVRALAAGPGTTLNGGVLRGPQDAPAAQARGTGFTFFGSGDGHGLGMSQWGAYGLAQSGWGYKKILTHFFSGTKVAKAANPVKNIRVELTYDRTSIHLTAKIAPVKLSVGRPAPKGAPVGKIPVGATWSVNAAPDGYAVRDAAGDLVGGKTWGGPSFNLYATYADRGGRVFVPEADAIWHRGFTYAHGLLEFNEYGCGSGGCSERLILPVGFEQYLLGIGEVPSSWPLDALRSQAVAARTYASYSIRHYGLRKSCNCHITDGAGDQTYVGYSKEQGAQGRRWIGAVNATQGRVITYKGSLIQAFFAASDGGHSENVEDAWHGGNPAYAVPYLRGVCDPGEYTSANPWTDWRYSFGAPELTSRLSPYTGAIGRVSRFPKVVRGAGGRVIRATVRGAGGAAAVTGTELRAALGLPDDRVWINQDKNIVGAVRAKYDSVMCRPGLPTTPVLTLPHGSRQRFQTGGIYRNGAADVTVWLRGPIDTEYVGAGGATGALGLPVSDVAAVGRARTTCASCRRILFEHGRIYSKAGAGTHALWGAVLKAYLAHGGTTGHLGFPTSRVHGNGAGATSATFEHGRIDCLGGGTCTVG